MDNKFLGFVEDGDKRGELSTVHVDQLYSHIMFIIIIKSLVLNMHTYQGCEQGVIRRHIQLWRKRRATNCMYVMCNDYQWEKKIIDTYTS